MGTPQRRLSGDDIEARAGIESLGAGRAWTAMCANGSRRLGEAWDKLARKVARRAA